MTVYSVDSPGGSFLYFDNVRLVLLEYIPFDEMFISRRDTLYWLEAKQATSVSGVSIDILCSEVSSCVVCYKLLELSIYWSSSDLKNINFLYPMRLFGLYLEKTDELVRALRETIKLIT